MTLAIHTTDVEEALKKIVTKLSLSSELRQAIQLAGHFHDSGKQRDFWQRSIGNFASDVCWAKSGATKGLCNFGDAYRHEFGSLLDALNSEELQQLSSEMKDVVLHLIASHHGRARPHFSTDEVFDPKHDREKVIRMATEVPGRFERLQRRYGRWGLAYLESLLRAADYAASAKPSETVEVRR